ncbi:hypothetical protein [Frankia sp. QA3]|uniref:hypothetical protein n=1 Tax=Frankia sp. QA3 TaxID=710111 RepID=UPI000269CCC7|nr:hypothetical protein [Frankia sp. QA3]EIV96076.1 hypothetical protein FraQA3DRAFT_5938 [Frankia sp. QA3]
MSSDDRGTIEAARAIRPYLTDWFSPQDAAALDQHLADVLNPPGGLSDPADLAGMASRLRGLLETHRLTRRFLGDVLADAPYYRPPEHQPRYLRGRNAAGPAGDPSPVLADRYTCPHGDYTWYRPDVSTPVVRCPTHQVSLGRG